MMNALSAWMEVGQEGGPSKRPRSTALSATATRKGKGKGRGQVKKEKKQRPSTPSSTTASTKDSQHLLKTRARLLLRREDKLQVIASEQITHDLFEQRQPTLSPLSKRSCDRVALGHPGGRWTFMD